MRRLRFCFFVALRERHRVLLARDLVAESRFGSCSVWCPSCSCTDPDTQEVWVGISCATDQTVRQRQVHSPSTREVPHGHDDKARRGAAAQSRVQRRQVSRRHKLTGAPRNNVTLEELRAAPPDQEGARTRSCVSVWTTTKLWICCVQLPRFRKGTATT